MTYDLQTFASVPLCMEPAAARSWIARHLGQPHTTRAEWMAAHRPAGPEITAGWWEDMLEDATEHLNVRYDEDSGEAHFQVDGVIWKGADMFLEACYGLYNTERIARNLEEIAARNDVSAVIITLNTPGGTARGTLEAAQAIKEYQAASGVRVAAAVPDLCCSAGYYLASACELIAASPAALVGSIGTMAVAVDSSGLYKNMGFDITLYTGGGDLKGMGSEGVEWTKAWHDKLKGEVEEYRKEFLGFVKSNRPGISSDSFRGDAFEARKAPKAMIDILREL
ncbi:MAG: hypothetical protein EOP87_00250 [Verrucomicrobiaceae bacterium]|nr:MAG: hypothetical protein EOP87_00250 [Verrucomicrobiaceae bacterium]